LIFFFFFVGTGKLSELFEIQNFVKIKRNAVGAVNLPSFLWVTGEGTGGAGGGLTGFLLLSISNGMGPTAMNPVPRITLSSGLERCFWSCYQKTTKYYIMETIISTRDWNYANYWSIIIFLYFEKT
jgi:hypothetical protein